MKREVLWSALATAADAQTNAVPKWMADPSPTTTRNAQLAIRRYVEALAPVIGAEAAFSFEAAFARFETAVDRQEQLTATLGGRDTAPDASDVEILHRLAEEQTAAL